MNKCAIGLFLLLFVALFCSPVQAVTEEYVINVMGGQFGELQVNYWEGDGGRVGYEANFQFPSASTAIYSAFVFDSVAFPRKPLHHELVVTTPQAEFGFDMVWEDELAYSISPFAIEGTLPRETLSLDNNAIADYTLLSWLFPQQPDGSLSLGVVVPTLLLQGAQVIPATVSFVGEEMLGNKEVHHYVVNMGLEMNIWVTANERRLVRLYIPQQDYEVLAKDLIKDLPIQETPIPENIVETEASIDAGNATLRGTLSLPDSAEAPTAAVVLVAGSGPTDRDGNSQLVPGRVDNLKQIAHFLSSQGYAVMRYDKRGIGKSTIPNPDQLTFPVYADDVLSVVRYMQDHPLIDHERVFVVGHSEGALLASMAAARSEDIAGIALVAGPGFVIGDVLRTQVMLQAQAMQEMGQGKDLVDSVAKALDELYAAIQGDLPYDAYSYGIPSDFADVFLGLYFQRSFAKDYLPTDPAEVLSQVQCPVLIVQGDADSQVDLANVRILSSSLPADQQEVVIIPGLDHALKLTAGTALGYGDDRVVDRTFLDTLHNWLKRN